MIDNRKVGRRIAELRQNSGLTQQQLAAMMNVSHQAVSKWEGGQAMPDIQTLLGLTRFFGLTVEQLVEPREDEEESESTEWENDKPETESNERMEANKMSIQQLLQMAPYMTKEAVEEIALGMEGKLTASQIARLAPYLSTECVEALIDKHHPEFTWDSLRRLAPHMRRERVDELARAIASGKETLKTPEESFNRTMNDIGKAFDDIGKGVDKAVRKALRFGENVINEVTTAINELSNDAAAAPESRVRSEKAQMLRRRVFERALADENWDWLSEHVGELEDGDEIKSKIAVRARELGMHDWICAHMGGYADEFTIEAAIRSGNWSWLGDNAWRFEADMQRRVARAAMQAENWQWLGAYSAGLDLGDEAAEIARTAWQKGAKVLASQIAERHLNPVEVDLLARACWEAEDHETIRLLLNLMGEEVIDEILTALAARGDWDRVREYVPAAAQVTVEKLMEAAVDQGNFEAVDLLDQYL